MKMDLRHGKVCYWALIFSVAAHSVTLAVFTGVKLSGRTEAEDTPKPVISLQMIERIVAEPTPKPKPRIEPIHRSQLWLMHRRKRHRLPNRLLKPSRMRLNFSGRKAWFAACVMW
ncbi:MAG: hypothetical protein ACYSO7_00700 [Planctomycetota bacterium]|jgi:hypothetical protein